MPIRLRRERRGFHIASVAAFGRKPQFENIEMRRSAETPLRHKRQLHNFAILSSAAIRNVSS